MSFTIIVVNLNNAKGLEQTLLSLEAQEDKNFHVVVVDGESKDGSSSVLLNYKSNRRYTVSIRKDSCVWEAMNNGVRLSNSKYIAFLNSGDVLYDNYVVKRFNTALIFGFDVVIPNIIVTKKNKTIHTYHYESLHEKSLGRGLMPPHPMMCLQRELVIKSRAFDAHNWELPCDFILYCYLVHCQPLTCYMRSYAVKMAPLGISGGFLYRLKRIWKQTKVLKAQQISTSLLLIVLHKIRKAFA